MNPTSSATEILMECATEFSESEPNLLAVIYVQENGIVQLHGMQSMPDTITLLGKTLAMVGETYEEWNKQ